MHRPPRRRRRMMADEKADFVWVVRQNADLTEGRGPMKDVAVCSSEEEAMAANYKVTGVMGVPAHYGGDVVKVQLNVYPPAEEKVWGYRKGWDDKWGQGWVDNRDRPNAQDPEWREYQRLKTKFDSANMPPPSFREAS